MSNTDPGFTGGGSLFGRIASQWNQYFGAKVDAENGTADNLTLTGLVNVAAATFSSWGSQILKKLTVNSNVVMPPTPLSGTIVQVLNADGVTSRIEIDAFSAVAALTAQLAGGSNLIKQALGSGVEMLRINVHGFTGTAGSGVYGDSSAAIRFFSGGTGPYTPGHTPAEIRFATTALGSGAMTDRWVMSPGGGLYSVGVLGGDIGAGGINAASIAVAGSLIGSSGLAVDGNFRFNGSGALAHASMLPGYVLGVGGTASPLVPREPGPLSAALIFLQGATYSTGFQNRLRGNSMSQWYSGNAVSIGTAGGWANEGVFVLPTGAAVSAIRTPTPFVNSPVSALQVVGTVGCSDVKLRFVIESTDMGSLPGAQGWFQVTVANLTGGAKTPTLETRYPITADNWASSVGDLAPSNLTTIAAGSGVILDYTFNISANGTRGYELIVDLGALAGGSAVLVTGFDLRAVALGATVPLGITGAPPIPEIITTALDSLWCQRFREGSYDNGVTPGTVTTNGNSALRSPGVGIAGKDASFKVIKRAVPTITAYSPNSGASGKTYDEIANADVNTTTRDVGMQGFTWLATTAAASISFKQHWFADASITGG